MEGIKTVLAFQVSLSSKDDSFKAGLGFQVKVVYTAVPFYMKYAAQRATVLSASPLIAFLAASLWTKAYWPLLPAWNNAIKSSP